MKKIEKNKILRKSHTRIIILNYRILLENSFFFKKKNLSMQEKELFFSFSKKRKEEFLGIRFALEYLGIKKKFFIIKKENHFF